MENVPEMTKLQTILEDIQQTEVSFIIIGLLFMILTVQNNKKHLKSSSVWVWWPTHDVLV